MKFARIVAWICVIAGLAALSLNIVLSVELDQRTPAAVRDFWPRLNPLSFEIARLLQETVFGFWSGLALIVVGVLLFILFSDRIDRA